MSHGGKYQIKFQARIVAQLDLQFMWKKFMQSTPVTLL